MSDTAVETEDFVCPVEGCGKRFKRKEHLVRHGASHSDVKPFVCGICDRSFARSDVLSRHIKQHGPDIKPQAITPILNACDACHNRKAKCSGGDPCKFCSNHGVQCTRDRAVARHRATREAQHGLMSGTQTTVLDQAIHSEDRYDAAMGNFGDGKSSTDLEQPPAISPYDTLPFRPPTDIKDPSLQGVFDNNLLIALPAGFLGVVLSESAYVCGIDERMLDRFLHAYFTILYQRWPLIHLMSFEKRWAAPQFVWTIIMAGARCTPQQAGARALADHLQKELSITINEALNEQILKQSGDIKETLPLLQASTLFVVYSLYFGNDDELRFASQIKNQNIALLRSLGAYDPEIWAKEIPWADPKNPQWMQAETRKRLTCMSFLSDTYLSIMLNQPPGMKYQDLNCRLPCRNSWWWAMSSKDVHALRTADPSDRSPKTMSKFITDALAEDKVNSDVDFRALEVVDFHLVQCAIHALLWDVTEELENWHDLVVAYDYREIDHVYRTAELLCDKRKAYWASNLDFWKSLVEKEFWKRQKPGSRPDELIPRTPLESVNLILYNFSLIDLYSTLRPIEELAHYVIQQAPVVSQEAAGRIAMKLSSWAGTTYGRLSAYCAGQIFRQFSQREFTIKIGTMTLEPIPKTALFDAALVIWAFIRTRASCPDCIAGWSLEKQTAHTKRVSIECTFPYDSEFVTKWTQEDVRIKMKETILCQCNMDEILGLFEEQFMRIGEFDAYAAPRASIISALRHLHTS